jgi:hypothetical protein
MEDMSRGPLGVGDAKTARAFWSALLPAAGVDACESETDILLANDSRLEHGFVDENAFQTPWLFRRALAGHTWC